MRIISLGSICSVARQLDLLDMCQASLPFDWVRTPDFETILDLIESRFDKYLVIDNFIFVKDSDKFPLGIDAGDMTSTHSAVYRHKLFNITFFHDFTSDLSLEEQFDEFCVKHQRRIDRFYQVLMEEKNLLFVRDDIKRRVNNEHITRFFTILSSINRDLDAKLLLIVHNPKKIKLNIVTCGQVTVYDDHAELGEWWRPNVPWKELFLRCISC